MLSNFRFHTDGQPRNENNLNHINFSDWPLEAGLGPEQRCGPRWSSLQLTGLLAPPSVMNDRATALNWVTRDFPGSPGRLLLQAGPSPARIIPGPRLRDVRVHALGANPLFEKSLLLQNFVNRYP